MTCSTYRSSIDGIVVSDPNCSKVFLAGFLMLA
jgi:hypothetical protein